MQYLIISRQTERDWIFYNTFKGIAFQNENLEDLKEVLGKGLYPCVGLKSQGGSVEVNFGHKKFKYAGNFILIII